MVRDFPNLTIVKASAGSGKTYFLTKTFLEFLLSEKIPFNDLKNILAITFSNNAAIEIKEKIITWLKNLYFEKEQVIEEFEKMGFKREELKTKAENLIEKILNSYSDFQVRTIDSFLTKIFKAESLKFGYAGDFQILMNYENFLYRAFEIFLSIFNEKSPLAKEILSLIEKMEETLPLDSLYPWNPSIRIFMEIRNLYRIIIKSTENIDGNLFAKFEKYSEDFENSKKNLLSLAENFYKEIKTRELKLHSRSNFLRKLEALINGRYNEVFDLSVKKIPIISPPEDIINIWNNFRKARADYIRCYSKIYCKPYITLLLSFEELLRKLKLKEQKIFIDDVNRFIGEKIGYLKIPEIYIKLGERIYHYFIDEFQDTSPSQWRNLKILIENSLSEGGSLLIVGDTKQAIYGFRGADYTIMSNLIKEANRPKDFPSVGNYKIRSLSNNYRSGDRIIKFVEKFFIEELKDYLQDRSEKEEFFNRENIPLPLTLSDLYECKQIPHEKLKGIGYVKIEKIEYEEDEERIQKEAFINLIRKIKEKHNFYNRDIAILAFKNTTLHQLSAWLNEKGMDFISFSSLDIRNRKIIGELLSLLKFLFSPIDNFSFSTFLLSEIARKNFEGFIKNQHSEIEEFLFYLRAYEKKNNASEAYYVRFRDKFPLLWEKFFSSLFKKVGYLPLYDMVSEIYMNFRLFELFPEEEGALIKFLEILFMFEEKGGGLKDFIEFYETSGDEDETFWDVGKPFGKDAITLMTVHKAKGLEFPAVLLWTDMDTIRLDRIIIHSGEFLRLPSERFLDEEYLSDLKKIREDIYNKNFTEDLNKLYVALTRAKEVLYIAIPCKRGTKKPCPRKNDAVRCLFNLETPEEEYKRKIHDHDGMETQHSSEILHLYPESKAFHPYTFQEAITSFTEIRRGQFLHKIMATIEYFDYTNPAQELFNLKGRIEKLNFELKTSFDVELILEEIIKLLQNQTLQKYFIPLKDRLVFTEKEISDEKGALYRIDRLILDREKLTILEYKFGKNFDEKEATEQVKQYIKLLSSLYTKREIEALIYFSPSQRIKEIRG